MLAFWADPQGLQDAQETPRNAPGGGPAPILGHVEHVDPHRAPRASGKVTSTLYRGPENLAARQNRRDNFTRPGTGNLVF